MATLLPHCACIIWSSVLSCSWIVVERQEDRCAGILLSTVGKRAFVLNGLLHILRPFITLLCAGTPAYLLCAVLLGDVVLGIVLVTVLATALAFCSILGLWLSISVRSGVVAVAASVLLSTAALLLAPLYENVFIIMVVSAPLLLRSSIKALQTGRCS